jgi:hypothetical protein
MTCRQLPTYLGVPANSGPHTTEADCLKACREGACCEGTACTVKPACQCQGTGKTFKGVGTTCAGVNCGCCGNGETIAGKTATLYVDVEYIPSARWCPGRWVNAQGFQFFYVKCPDGSVYSQCASEKLCENPVEGYWVDKAGTVGVIFDRSSATSSCDLSLQGLCPGFGDRSASVFLRPSPCKIAATVDCRSLIGTVDSYRGISSFNPYWAWDYGPTTSEYTTSYYVHQYETGTGISTVTQSVVSTPLLPSVPGYTWYLSRTVAVNMRLALV